MGIRWDAQKQDRKNGSSGVPWGIHIRSPLDEQPHYQIVSPRTCCVEWQDSVEDRIYRLAMLKRVLDEANVTCGCCRMQAQVGDWEGLS